jgi:hypothetical protein
MVDPDGGDMMRGDEDEVRQAAWYSLTGGAYGWGGFTTDMWHGPNQINTTKLKYFGYLLGFLDNNAVRFWEMTPQPSLISTNTTNSLLANVGAQYLAYVLSGATVNITLGTGTYSVKYFNPVTGVTTSGTDTTGPATRTFTKPTGASDWVVFVSIIRRFIERHMPLRGSRCNSDVRLNFNNIIYATHVQGEVGYNPNFFSRVV